MDETVSEQFHSVQNVLGLDCDFLGLDSSYLSDYGILRYSSHFINKIPLFYCGAVNKLIITTVPALVTVTTITELLMTSSSRRYLYRLEYTG